MKLSCRFASLSQAMVRAGSIGLNHPELLLHMSSGWFNPIEPARTEVLLGEPIIYTIVSHEFGVVHPFEPARCELYLDCVFSVRSLTV